MAFGLVPNVVVGDLDSLDPNTLARLGEVNVAVETYPRDKNATDGQLALERALRERPTEVWLLGFLGGPRLDQALANVLLLTTVETRTVLADERNECVLVRPGITEVW